MLIENLSLENFGIIKKANLEFDSGINLIIGENYQGKSHILKSIAFMLINSTEKKIEDFCNWDEDFFSTSLKFKYLGKEFFIKYFFDKNTDSLSRELKIEGEGQPYIGSSCTNKLAELFDPSICKSSILSFQGDLNLVTTTPSKRRDELKKVYNLNFEKEIKLIKSDVEQINIKLKEISNDILIYESKEYNIKDEEDLPLTEEEYNNLQQEAEELNNKIISFKKEKEIYEKNIQNKINLENQIQQGKEKKEFLEKDIEKYNNNKFDLEKELEDDFYKKKKELENKLVEADWEKELKNLEKQKEEIVLSRPIIFNHQELTDIKNKLKEINSKIILSKNKYDSILKGVCSECGKPYTSDEKDLIESEYLKQKKENEIYEARLKELEDLKKESNKIEKENDIKKNNINVLSIKIENERKKIEKEKENLLKEIKREDENIELKIKNIKNQILNIKNNIIFLNEQIEEKEKSIKTFEEQLKNIVIPFEKPEVSEEMFFKNSEIIFLIKSYDSIIEKNKIYKEDNLKTEKEKKENEKKLKKLKEKRDELSVELFELEYGSVILKKDFPNFVIDSSAKEIQNGMNDFLSKVYKGKNKVIIEKTKDGIGVFYGKRKKDISIASGFEKQLFNISYKNSFSKKSNLGILFLDEIDSFASEKNSKLLFDAIAKLNNNYEQIFIITHKSFVQDILIQDYKAKAFLVEDGKINLY